MNEQKLLELAKKYPNYFDVTSTNPKALVAKDRPIYYDATKQKEDEVWAEIQHYNRDENTFAIFEGGKIFYYGQENIPRFRHIITVWVIIDGKYRERDIIISEGLISPKQLANTKRLFRSQTGFLEVIDQFV